MYLGSELLPVTPEKISVKIKGQNETFKLINEGEVSVLKAAGLTSSSFTALLPNTEYPFARYLNGFKDAKHFLDYLESLKTSKKPFQWIVARQYPTGKKLFNTNMTVSLEDYEIKEDAKKAGFDVQVEIKLKQYKSYATKTFSVSLPSATAPIALPVQRPASTSTPVYTGGGVPTTTTTKKKTTTTTTKTYKVCIPGMSMLSIKATSEQEAITKAMGNTWTGSVEVDGKTMYVAKGIISDPPVNKAVSAASPTVQTSVTNVSNKTNFTTTVTNAAKKVVTTVVNAVKNPVETVKNVVNKVTDFFNNLTNKSSSSSSKTTTTAKVTVPKLTTTAVKTVSVNLKNKLITKA